MIQLLRWISLNFCPLNLLLVQSHQAEIIVVKRFIQRRNSVTVVSVEPRSCNQGRRKTTPLFIRSHRRLLKRKVANGTDSNGLNPILGKMRIAEQSLGHATLYYQAGVPIFVEHWGDNLQFHPNFVQFSKLGDEP